MNRNAVLVDGEVGPIIYKIHNRTRKSSVTFLDFLRWRPTGTLRIRIMCSSTTQVIWQTHWICMRFMQSRHQYSTLHVLGRTCALSFNHSKNMRHPSILWATPSSASLFRWMKACRHARMRACGDAGSQACGHAGMQACMHWFAIRSPEFQNCVDVESIRGRFGIDLGSPSGRLWV